MSQKDIPARTSHTGPRVVSDDQSQRARINLGQDPGALIASVPSLLGFTPAESLVLIGLYDQPGPCRTMCCLLYTF